MSNEAKKHPVSEVQKTTKKDTEGHKEKEREQKEYEYLVQSEYRELAKAGLPTGYWALTKKTGIEPDWSIEQELRKHSDRYFNLKEFLFEGEAMYEGEVDEWKVKYEYPALVCNGCMESLKALRELTHVPLIVTALNYSIEERYLGENREITYGDIQEGYVNIIKNQQRIQYGFVQALQEMTGIAPKQEIIEKSYHDHLVQYVNEHYLHAEQKEHQTNHIPFSKELLHALQQVWGVRQQVEKNIIIQTQRAITAITQTGETTSEKTIPVTLVPVRGVFRIFSGDIGDACFTSQHKTLAQGTFEKLTAFVFVTNRGKKDERIQGSVLVVEAETPEGIPVLVVRANNPSENFMRSVDAKICMTRVLEEMTALAQRRNIPLVVVPRDGASASSSNREIVVQTYRSFPWYDSADPIELKNEPETRFNGYCNFDKNGASPVIPIS